ncbi:hypothetical protein EVAR_71474_1 [Eumeta japonica]|uniref:Uncharacterized protein n=1 Tax=Eumeta variegata TaxID=151549 RepID=A0A4C1SSC6_EUMVA|nr:hypothetical protein EVAR_71474_1 [Eumeta japonica]
MGLRPVGPGQCGPAAAHVRRHLRVGGGAIPRRAGGRDARRAVLAEGLREGRRCGRLWRARAYFALPPDTRQRRAFADFDYAPRPDRVKADMYSNLKSSGWRDEDARRGQLSDTENEIYVGGG